MFEAADESFDFLGSNLTPGEFERDGSPQRGVGRREPFGRGVPVALKESKRLAEQSGGPK